MDNDIDYFWDLEWCQKNNVAYNSMLYEKKLKEWRVRDWVEWLNSHLVFPFMVERVEDEEDAFFTDIADTQPFRLGHTMKAIKIEDEDDLYGIILKVREGRRIGYVPLCDVEISDQDTNYWPVTEYLSWFPHSH